MSIKKIVTPAKPAKPEQLVDIYSGDEIMKGISFKPIMIKAIVEGRKTQTT